MFLFKKIKYSIRHKIEKLVLRIIDKYDFSKIIRKELPESRSISFNLKNIPHLQTAIYVSEKMINARAVKSKVELYDTVLEMLLIDGNILEFGVYKGESINYFAQKLSHKNIYGFDSFMGLPEFWRDGFNKEFFSLEGEMPVVGQNVKLIKGLFEDTIDAFLIDYNIDKISLIHIDCDLYSSTKTVLDHIKDKIVSGTIIIFDEYFNYSNWQMHEFKAFQEFIKDNNLNYKYLFYNETDEQVAVQICE